MANSLEWRTASDGVNATASSCSDTVALELATICDALVRFRIPQERHLRAERRVCLDTGRGARPERCRHVPTPTQLTNFAREAYPIRGLFRILLSPPRHAARGSGRVIPGTALQHANPDPYALCTRSQGRRGIHRGGELPLGVVVGAGEVIRHALDPLECRFIGSNSERMALSAQASASSVLPSLFSA